MLDIRTTVALWSAKDNHGIGGLPNIWSAFHGIPEQITSYEDRRIIAVEGIKPALNSDDPAKL